ncbi:uncharacterized protein LY89DRAFT_662789 [Mollisia scopiformis]|uniref:Uncharacterized protein n=1 Tax=Mollisia scopiformis TaxID=149040 RepID=A0A194XWB3_MOLSC|nr:uncharacterized protein LY89DRAFT_662789 [Mollisia scopiformis]KUJ24012.1 hypothetical protein LY89DRAFT_662789 [Mollisia scopiformis]
MKLFQTVLDFLHKCFPAHKKANAEESKPLLRDQDQGRQMVLAKRRLITVVECEQDIEIEAYPHASNKWSWSTLLCRIVIPCEECYRRLVAERIRKRTELDRERGPMPGDVYVSPETGYVTIFYSPTEIVTYPPHQVLTISIPAPPPIVIQVPRRSGRRH